MKHSLRDLLRAPAPLPAVGHLGMRGVSLAAMLLAAAGCEAAEDRPSSLIAGPRILALAASPPVASATGSATLAAAVVDAGGADARMAAGTEVRWRVCSPWRAVVDPRVDCTGEHALEGEELPAPAAPGELRLSMPQVLAAFPPPQGQPGGDPADQPAPDAGACSQAPAFVELPVVVEARVDDTALVAIKRMRVTADAEASQRQNPRIDGLMLGDAVIAPEEETTFRPGGEHRLRVEIAPDSLDWTCDGEVEVLEPVRVHFYVTAGRLSAPYIDIHADEAPPSLTWTAPERGAAVLWLVAIDGDGGATWARFGLAPSA